MNLIRTSRPGSARQCLVAAASFCIGAPSAVLAQTLLADPTRPPEVARPAATAPTGAGAQRVESLVWPQLQAVRLSTQGGSSALVDGRLVRVGDRVGALTVVAIDADGILMRGARHEQRHALLPGGVKTVSGDPVTRQAAATGKVTR